MGSIFLLLPGKQSTESRRFLDVWLDFTLEQVNDQPTRLNNIQDPSLRRNLEVINGIRFIDEFRDHKLITAQ